MESGFLNSDSPDLLMLFIDHFFGGLPGKKKCRKTIQPKYVYFNERRTGRGRGCVSMATVWSPAVTVKKTGAISKETT